jgi:hypothetical protein
MATPSRPPRSAGPRCPWCGQPTSSSAHIRCVSEALSSSDAVEARHRTLERLVATLWAEIDTDTQEALWGAVGVDGVDVLKDILGLKELAGRSYGE